jgi:hypothetical protein
MRTARTIGWTGAVLLATGALAALLGCAAEEPVSRLSERQRDSVLATRNATVAGALAARDSSATRARRGIDARVEGGSAASPNSH